VLTGRTNPAGRLPVTWARALRDYPASDPGHPERSAAGVTGKTTFREGLDVGYRGFDRRGLEPLFPFGHGLSYTRFDYADLKVTPTPDSGLDIQVRIHNAGDVDGEEIPQVYLGPPSDWPKGVGFPVRKLVAFDRVNLKAGETRTVRLHAPPRQLEYWSVAGQRWVTPSGERKVSVGASSRDLRLEAAAYSR
jgi:beta-glucosidase